MSACDNFVEQLWRKGKCVNCFQSRERHQNGDGSQDDTSSANRTANCRPKRVLIHPQSPSNRNVKAFHLEKTAKSLKDENGREEYNREGANSVKTIAPCTAHATNDNTASRGGSIASDTSRTEQHSKSFVVTKPKPVPRPKPRPPTRAIELEKSGVSRDESPQESDDGLNDSSALENSLGKSHNRPQCNANSLENSEVALSIPDHDIKESEELYNKSNIETVCDTIVDEEAIMDVQDSIDKDSVDHDENVKMSSKNSAVVDSSDSVTDLSDLKFEDDDDSDVDGYVAMKSNIVLFTAEPIQVHNIHKTDVMEPNIEVNLDLHGKATIDNETVDAASTCDSEIDEGSETSSGVLEFRNPLCLITNEIMGSSSDSQIGSGACDRLNSNKISSKSNSTEPFYVNRLSSTSSTDTGSSSHDSGYENTRKSTRSNSTNSASGNSSDVAAANVNIEGGDSAEAPEYVVFTETSDRCAVESSETSSSSWGSSTWDSCSTSDFQENSCEGLLVERAFGKFDARKKSDKHHPEASSTQLKSGQAVVADKGSVDAGHVYVNMASKPFTKPYKVVDISTGVSCPTNESQNDVPPLPPKEKDLKKDKVDDHVYLEPSEEAPSRPEHGPPDEKKEAVTVPRETAPSSPPPSPAPNSTTDKSAAVRRAPAPRPRSRVPSQFGTLPKPAPRMSRILNDAPVENKDVKEQKVTTAPPVGKSFNLSCVCDRESPLFLFVGFQFLSRIMGCPQGRC